VFMFYYLLNIIYYCIAQESSTHDILPSSAYTLHRVLHGVPEGIIDMPPMQAFPMESNLDVMGACQLYFTVVLATLSS
jgi:hypothetical protein